jgi:hypothetical protein
MFGTQEFSPFSRSTEDDGQWNIAIGNASVIQLTAITISWLFLTVMYYTTHCKFVNVAAVEYCNSRHAVVGRRAACGSCSDPDAG